MGDRTPASRPRAAKGLMSDKSTYYGHSAIRLRLDSVGLTSRLPLMPSPVPLPKLPGRRTVCDAGVMRCHAQCERCREGERVCRATNSVRPGGLRASVSPMSRPRPASAPPCLPRSKQMTSRPAAARSMPRGHIRSFAAVVGLDPAPADRRFRRPPRDRAGPGARRCDARPGAVRHPREGQAQLAGLRRGGHCGAHTRARGDALHARPATVPRITRQPRDKAPRTRCLPVRKPRCSCSGGLSDTAPGGAARAGRRRAQDHQGPRLLGPGDRWPGQLRHGPEAGHYQDLHPLRRASSSVWATREPSTSPSTASTSARWARTARFSPLAFGPDGGHRQGLTRP